MRRVLELSFAGDSGSDWEKRNAKLVGRVEPMLAGLDLVRKGALAFSAELTPANARRLADVVRRVKAAGRDQFNGAILTESAGPEEAERAEWFVVRPAEMLDPETRSKNGLNSCKADRQKGGAHLLRYHDADVYLSERVKALVEAQGLPGLELVWVKDVGKFRVPQWYHAFATPPLGRGVDHPWFDAATYGRFSRYGTPEDTDFQPADPTWRCGASLFGLDQLRPDAGRGEPPELADLLRALRDDLPLHAKRTSFVETPRRVLRQFLPAGDVHFAYAWAHPIQRSDGSGYRYPGYRVCASRAARDLLIQNRLARPADFEPIIVLDEAPDGAEALDRTVTAPLPGPMFAGQGPEKLRAEERAAREKHEAKPRPEKPADFKPAMSKLKRLAKKDKDNFRRDASAEALAAATAPLPRPLPKRWADVLAVSDGFTAEDSPAGDGAAVRVAAAGEVAGVHAGAAEVARAARPDLSPHWLCVAETDGGDRVFLDTAKVTPDGDCPVIRLDHETGDDAATWPGIAAFLDDLLAKDDE